MPLRRHPSPLPLAGLLTMATTAAAAEPGVAVGLWQGWRESDLDWAIVGADSQYRDIAAWTTRLALTLDLAPLTVRIQAEHGLVVGGDSRDRVFAGDGSVSEQIDADADSGRTGAVEVGLGWRLPLGDWRLLPAIGYARSEQRLTQRDGVRTVPDGAVLDGLDNRYDARWSGPWLAVGIGWSNASGSFTVQAHVWTQAVAYHADGDLNLRDDLEHPTSFSQNADGYGLGAALAATWVLDATWALTLAIERERMRTADGDDVLHLADGTTVVTPLVTAELDTAAVLIGLSARF